MRRPNGSIATNDADKAQILANHFETVFTRESSLPEVVTQGRIDAAKIDYVQITCGDVKRILKSLKKDKSSGADGIPPILLHKLRTQTLFRISLFSLSFQIV